METSAVSQRLIPNPLELCALIVKALPVQKLCTACAVLPSGKSYLPVKIDAIRKNYIRPVSGIRVAKRAKCALYSIRPEFPARGDEGRER
jgi:hypothetical protein